MRITVKQTCKKFKIKPLQKPLNVFKFQQTKECEVTYIFNICKTRLCYVSNF
jgi:hypothetical protein